MSQVLFVDDSDSDDDKISDLTPRGFPNDAEDLEEITSRKEIAYRVYYDLWKSFYDWEDNYSRSTLSQLNAFHYPSPQLPSASSLSAERHWKEPVDEHEESFIIEDIDPISGRHTRAVVTWEPVQVTTLLSPYPRYTSCTPQSRSVKAEGESRARFAYFADDPDFDVHGLLKSYEDFAWQNDFMDPDLEMIEMEVVRKLLYKHNFTLQDIDNLGIMKTPMRETNRAGLIWYFNQRDYPWWPASQTNEYADIQRDWVDPSLDLYETISKDIPTFCGNLNCIIVNCGIHLPAHPVPPAKPTKTSEMLKQAKGAACKNDCYKSADEGNINMVNTHWDDEDKALFRSVMQFIPDARPCDLSIICRRPCVEMYVERLQFFRDQDIDTTNTDHHQVNTNLTFDEDERDRDTTPLMSIPAGPCYHPGPCNQHADCPCYHTKQRCLRDCRCSLQCEIRFKGCKCRPSKKNKKSARMYHDCCISDLQCICRLLMRECDPDICKGCGARSLSKKSSCGNTDLQKGVFMPIRVKQSDYGLGAFAMTNIKNGSYVGEYVGEISFDTSRPLQQLQEHIGLNYTFELAKGHEGMTAGTKDSVVMIDSWNVGNEVRYLNHSDNPNCEAHIMFVNGCHRLVLCSLNYIKAGTELTLDYGTLYWGNKNAKGPGQERPNFDPATIRWELYECD